MLWLFFYQLDGVYILHKDTRQECYSYPGPYTPHVHIYKGDMAVKILIEGDCEILRAEGRISRKELKKAIKLVKAHQTELLKIWEEIHG